ncbi:Signal recognition particle protein [Glycine soja]
MILNLNPEELSRNRVSESVNYNAMVYITSWDEFVERSVQLFRADPDSTRYVMKYRHCDGKLVLKVTDNRQCLKYKTDQAQEAKKMEKLNNIFFTLMARGPEVDPSEVTGKEPMDTQTTKRGRGRKQ